MHKYPTTGTAYAIVNAMTKESVIENIRNEMEAYLLLDECRTRCNGLYVIIKY